MKARGQEETPTLDISIPVAVIHEYDVEFGDVFSVETMETERLAASHTLGFIEVNNPPRGGFADRFFWRAGGGECDP